MNSDPPEGVTTDIFADMFPPDGPNASSVHEKDGTAPATAAESDNWVESLYQTIMDPTLASKSVTLLTESPINVATSSPTISQPSSPVAESKNGDSIGAEPSHLEEMMEEDESNAEASPSDGLQHVTVFQPFAVPTLQFLRDSLKKYTELLSRKEPLDSIPARTDFLVTHYSELHGLKLRPKAINECLAQIRRDKETAQLSARIGNEELLDEIRNLLVLSDKKRKAYNKKKSQRHQTSSKVQQQQQTTAQTVMDTSTPMKTGLNGTDVSYARQGEQMQQIQQVQQLQQAQQMQQAQQIQQAQQGVMYGLNNNRGLATPTQESQPSNNLNSISTARSIRIGFCRGDASNFIGVADYGRLSQAIYREPYVQQLRARSMKVRTSIDAVFHTDSSVAGEDLLSHPLTYVNIPLHPSRNNCSIDCDRDRMVSYAEVIVDIGKPGRDVELGSNRSPAQQPTASSPGQVVPPDFSSFVLLKVVTRVYSQAALLSCKTDPVMGYFVSPSSRFVRIMLPLQAGLWASLLNDLNNGIITEKRFDQICIIQTLLVKVPVRGSNDGNSTSSGGSGNGNGEFCAVHTFLWDFSSDGANLSDSTSPLSSTSRNHQQQQQQLPVAVTILASTNPRNMLMFPKLRGHKRARSRSLNELDRINVPSYLPERGFYLKNRTPSGAMSAIYPGFNNATFSAPRSGRLESAGSVDTTAALSDFSSQYYESPLATPSEDSQIATGTQKQITAGHPVMFRANMQGLGLKQHPGHLSLHPNISAPVVYRSVPKPRVKSEESAANGGSMMSNMANSAGSSMSNTSSSSLDDQQRHSVAVAEKLATCKPLAPAPAPAPRNVSQGDVSPNKLTRLNGPNEYGKAGKPGKQLNKLSNAGVAEMAPKAGCLVESLKLRFDGNYKFRYYNPEGKSDDQYAADSKK